MQAIDRSDILQALDKVLASDAFRQAGKLSRFLRFAVESTARGEADRIKEYVVGVEVFDRDEKYDPRMDPVVRVEARRLRAKLQEYYASEGAADTLRIDFPKGGYVPAFQRTAAAPRQISRRPIAVGLAGAAGVAVAAALLWKGSPPAKRIAVLPMRAYQVAGTDDLKRASDLASEQIITALFREPDISVISWPAAFGYNAAGKQTRQIGEELGVDGVAAVWAREEGGATRITVHMLDAVTGSKMYVESFDLQAMKAPRIASVLRQRLLAK